MSVKSISISDLYEVLGQYIKDHPENKDKPIYHDALHLDGEIDDKGNFLELY